MNKDLTYFVVIKGTNMVQLIGPNTPFMGDENAANFRAKKLTESKEDEDSYEAILIADFKRKFGGEKDEDKSE